jgi:DNA modification methylase
MSNFYDINDIPEHLRQYFVTVPQIGLEDTPQEYVARLTELFHEIKRVLRSDGTCWLNLGDSFAGSGRGPTGHNGIGNQEKRQGFESPKVHQYDGLKPKDLMGIPWRVAFALQDDGWYLRSDIIWNKPNPMPESVRDRPTRAHEYVFLLTKSAKYWYDADAIKEPVAASSVSRLQQNVKAQTGSFRAHGGNKTNGAMKAVGNTHVRNKRSVWTITTKPFRGAHFATFPPDLIEPMVLAGCPEGGIVLDPFGGSGTTGLVAKRHNRHFTLLELNPEYATMAYQRISAEFPDVQLYTPEGI